jgi:hypothetical protein
VVGISEPFEFEFATQAEDIAKKSTAVILRPVLGSAMEAGNQLLLPVKPHSSVCIDLKTLLLASQV